MTPVELAMVLASALLHATWNTAAKGSRSPAGYLVATGLASALAGLPVLFAFSFAEVPAPLWGVLAGTSIAHALYAFWLSRAYVHGELTLVYPISRTTPAFMPLVAIPLLGESLTLAGALGIALVVLGMWLVQTDGRLRREDLASRGAAFAYLTLLATVAYSLFDKQAMALLDGAAWSGAAPRSVAYFYFLSVVPLPLFWLLARRDAPASVVREILREERAQVLGGVVAGFVSYALILEALRTASVSYVVAARQASVVFVVLFGVAWLRERPGPVRIAGVGASVGGVVLIALRG
jgi:drug/metabolite transporter (DMT)-like permease